MIFQPGKRQEKKQITRPIQKPTLADAQGIQVGKSIEWAHGNGSDNLTPEQLEFVRRETGVKSLPTVLVVQIHTLMRTKTCAQIVAHFAGRKGRTERTIKRYHAALSKVGGVVK